MLQFRNFPISLFIYLFDVAHFGYFGESCIQSENCYLQFGSLVLLLAVSIVCRFLLDLNTTTLYPAFRYTLLNFGDTPGIQGGDIFCF